MESGVKPVLRHLAAGATLSEAESEAVFGLVMDGQASAAQIASLLTALQLRGETQAELAGAARAMRSRMACVAAPAGTIDVCGTGGDGLGTLNVSTATAFVVAGCGVTVAKHGNRAVSSRAGGSDVLAALGVPGELTTTELEAQLRTAGLAFLAAPRHHPALRFAAAVRTELGFRTIFNLLGPMCSPARVKRQVIGVYDPRWAPPMAETLGALGSETVWVVHGMGLDELTLAGATQVCAWEAGRTRHFTVLPEDAGLGRAPVAAIQGSDAAGNARALLALLDGARGAYRDTVLLNAAACLVVAGRASDLRDGAGLAARSIDGGAAKATLDNLLHASPARSLAS